MSDPSVIRNNGWRQGALFLAQDHPQLAPHATHFVSPTEGAQYILISHDCDVLSSDYEKELWSTSLTGSDLQPILANFKEFQVIKNIP